MIATQVTLELSWYLLWLVPAISLGLMLAGGISGWVELATGDHEDVEEGVSKSAAYVGLLWSIIGEAFGLYACGYMLTHSLP